MKHLLLLLICLLSVGCKGTIPEKCDPVIIKVAVPTPAPIPPVIIRPSLPITGTASGDDEKAKEIASTIEVLKSYILELEGYIEAYRDKAEKNNQNLKKD